jgi:hypothetical protein
MRPIIGKSIHECPSGPKGSTEKLTIYPNPVKQTTINLQLPLGMDDPATYDELEMSIYTIMGQIVYSGTFKKKLNITSYQDGIYILTVRNNRQHKLYTGKLVISR